MSRNTIRRLLAVPAAAALLAIPAIAAAHAPLESSTPAPGANLDTAPTRVTLTFGGDSGGELSPDGSSFTVTDAGGATVGTGKVDLSVADRNVMSADVTISDPGIYTVKWTSQSIDGASLSGSFSFGYKATAAIPAASGGEDHDHEGGTPDTAVSTPTGGSAPLAVLGALLLVASGTLAGRQLLHARLVRSR
ncbi:MAG TPA: copper resistance CopC family protein [Candidatus Limnocylindria bacterium]|nr:copper resistance CopC family protein [Candidatus Limnocylindria bacterium]